MYIHTRTHAHTHTRARTHTHTHTHTHDSILENYNLFFPFNENEFKYTKNIDLFQNAAGVITRESCDQQNVINFMLDLAMVIF